MKQYSFLFENKESDGKLSIHWYKSFGNLVKDKQDSVCWLLQELDKHDHSLQLKISRYCGNNAQKCLNENEWRDSLVKSDYSYFTCENDEGCVVGVCLIDKPSPRNVGCYGVRMLIVDSNYRGRGIGGMLLNAAKKKFEKLFIRVVGNNEPAYGLYKKVGFKPWLIGMVWD